MQKDAAAPGLDIGESFARFRGHAEPAFRDAELDLSLRMSAPLTATAGTLPTELGGAQFGWFSLTLNVVPTASGGQARLGFDVVSNWTGPIPDANDLGATDDFTTNVEASTPPISVGEWVDCRMRVSFTSLPGGDASAHVELDVNRGGGWSTVATYDHASTRYRYYIWYAFGLTTYVGADATSFDFDNLAVLLR